MKINDQFPMVVAPRGSSRPWYPKYTGEVVVTSSGDEGFQVSAVHPFAKGRVGIRMWWREGVRKRRSE